MHISQWATQLFVAMVATSHAFLGPSTTPLLPRTISTTPVLHSGSRALCRPTAALPRQPSFSFCAPPSPPYSRLHASPAPKEPEEKKDEKEAQPSASSPPSHDSAASGQDVSAPDTRSYDLGEKGRQKAGHGNSDVQRKFDALVEEGKDLLGLVDYLKSHQTEIHITRPQVSLMLDKLADTQVVRENLMDRQAKGVVPVREKGMVANPNDFFQAPGRAFMPLEEFQKVQLEAITDTYAILKSKGLLRGYACISDQRGYSESYLSKSVDGDVIEQRTGGLPMSALTPGQAQNLWAYSGVALCVLELAICKFYGVDAGAVIPGTLLGFFVDRFLLGGRGFDALARVVLPRYKERIIRHEAGHFLLAHLLGCPVQDCVLRPVFNGATFGEAGTIFLDQTLFEQLEKAKVSASSLDRYSTIVMGGIAAEALTFQNAQGGSSDEQALILLMSLLGFPLDRISNQARWAALRAVLVIKDYPEAYEALVAALQAGKSVGQCVLAIEDALEATDRPLVPLPAVGPPPSPPPAPVPSSGAKEFADLQRVLMPSLPPSLANADLSNLTPSFTKGTDVIPAVEAREKKQLAALEEQLKARQRAVNFRLKQVTAQLEGKSPEEVSGMGGEEEIQGKIELRGEEMDEENEIEDQLKSLDEKLKALNMQLGGRVGGGDLGGRRGAR